MRNLKTLALAILATTALCAADLSVGASTPASGAPGATLSVPINYRATGSQLVALSFDLLYDKAKFTVTADTGAAATAARKAVTTSDLPGGIRVLILGTNILDLTAIADGVVATLSVRIATGASAGASPLQLANTTGSDNTGRSATLTPTSGSITVTGSGGGGSGGGGGTGGGTRLTIGSGSAITLTPGGSVTVPISFAAGGAQLVALSLDLLYDKSNLTITADAGPAATAARKAVQPSDLAGGLRLLVLGTNILDLTAIGDGPVVTLTIRAAATASGSFTLQMANTTGSDNTGRSVTVAASSATVSVSGSGGGGGGASATNQVLSHIADGGGWTTQYTFVNLDEANPAQISLNFLKQDGSPQALPIVGETATRTSVVRAIGAGGSVTIQTNGDPRGNTAIGWAELVTTGTVTGLATFRSAGSPDQFAAVGLTSSARRLVMPFDNLGAATGMALINTNKTAPAQIQVSIRDERGVSILNDVLVIPSNGHVSFDLPGKWPATAQRRGVLDFKAASPDITGLGFRFVGSAFSSLPMTAVP